MGDSSYGIFLASVGCIAGWIGFWAAVASIVRAHNRNAPPGSRAKRVMDAINIILVVPLLPLVPILAIVSRQSDVIPTKKLETCTY